MTDDACILRLSDSEWPSELADMLPGFAGGLYVYRTMAHQPELLGAWSRSSGGQRSVIDHVH